jgi:hypothetical protein
MGVSIGTGVQAWADQSGVGDSNRNVTQATGSAQPTYTASEPDFAGRPSVTFGGSHYLVSGTWSASLAQPATWYIVAKITGAAGTQELIDGGDSTHRHAIWCAPSLALTPIFAGTQLTASKNMVVPTVLCGVFNGASSAIYMNSTTASVTGAAGAQALTKLTVGATYNLAGLLSGKVAAIVAYSGAHDSATRASILAALGAYYGITVS